MITNNELINGVSLFIIIIIIILLINNENKQFNKNKKLYENNKEKFDEIPVFLDGVIDIGKIQFDKL